MLPVESPLKKIPCNRSCDFKTWLALSVDYDVHRPCRTIAIRLDVVDVESQFLHAAQSFQPARVFSYAACDDAMITHKRSDVSEISGSTAQTGATGKQIPQHFAQPHDFVSFALHWG